MDKKKDCKIPKCGAVAENKDRKVIVGAKQLKKALKAGRVEYVYLADNADPAITEPIAMMCRELHIQITWVRSMAELGHKCGIEVGAAAAAIIRL